LTGILDSDAINLTTDVADYSDGYKVKIAATLGTNSVPPAPGMNGICVGTNLSAATTIGDVTTLFEAPNGAYCLTWISAADSSSAWSEQPLASSIKAYWFKPAAWTAMTDEEFLVNLE